MVLTEEDISRVVRDVRKAVLTDIRSELKTLFKEEIRDIINSETAALNAEIASLKSDNVRMCEQLEKLTLDIDRQEAYSRRDCLRINGVLDDSGDHQEKTDEKLVAITIRHRPFTS